MKSIVQGVINDDPSTLQHLDFEDVRQLGRIKLEAKGGRGGDGGRGGHGGVGGQPGVGGKGGRGGEGGLVDIMLRDCDAYLLSAINGLIRTQKPKRLCGPMTESINVPVIFGGAGGLPGAGGNEKASSLLVSKLRTSLLLPGPDGLLRISLFPNDQEPHSVDSQIVAECVKQGVGAPSDESYNLRLYDFAVQRYTKSIFKEILKMDMSSNLMKDLRNTLVYRLIVFSQFSVLVYPSMPGFFTLVYRFSQFFLP